jgi:hypothetical protein
VTSQTIRLVRPHQQTGSLFGPDWYIVGTCMMRIPVLLLGSKSCSEPEFTILFVTKIKNLRQNGEQKRIGKRTCPPVGWVGVNLGAYNIGGERRGESTQRTPRGASVCRSSAISSSHISTTDGRENTLSRIAPRPKRKQDQRPMGGTASYYASSLVALMTFPIAQAHISGTCLSYG